MNQRLAFVVAILFAGITRAQTDISSLQKVRYVKPVLTNILYRGGGPGGKVLLPAPALNSLCHDGFSSAIYLYPAKDKSSKSVECTDKHGKANELIYSQIEFRDMTPILEQVHKSITQGLGPVYVHCWNGWHASGEVAAKALMQFCGVSGEQAGRYWSENIGDKPNLPKYGNIVKRIASFKIYEDLKITPAQQEQICPK